MANNPVQQNANAEDHVIDMQYRHNPVQQNANAEDHVIDMQYWLTQMDQKLANLHLSQSAGQSSCCIFRAPQNLVAINGKCYEPDVVSIGPYHHHKDSRLSMIEKHKLRFLKDLLERTKSEGLTLEDYYRAVQPLEAEARECYSPDISCPKDEFIEMLVLDGCFLIELFRKCGSGVEYGGDPLLSLSWVRPLIRKDLIRLENQIPFFVLDCLFKLTQMPDEKKQELTLSILTIRYFNKALRRSEEFVEKFQNVPCKHLLDFLRTIFLPEGPNKINDWETEEIQCISKLRRAGIKLKARRDDNFLGVDFKNGVIEMPTITVGDFMSTFLLNCVAYEQCQDSPRHVTAYAKLLDCLINTGKDVDYLCDENIIENWLGTNGEIAKFINNMGKGVRYDLTTSMPQLSDLFKGVNDYYENRWHHRWASFKYTYFRTPWSFISMVAAIVLLLLTVTQTFYSIISYARPR